MLQPRPLLFDLISAKTAWLGQRQALLGQNVANADTPGFRPRDLKPATFATLLDHAGHGATALLPARTTPNHLSIAPPASGPFRGGVVESAEVTPSGNGVELPEQLEKMAATEQDHQLATGLYRRYVGMIRTALGVPQG